MLLITLQRLQRGSSLMIQGPGWRPPCPQTMFCRSQAALPHIKTVVVQLKTRQLLAPSLHLHPALLSEGGTKDGFGEDLHALTRAQALVPPPLPPPPPALHLPLQKDKSKHLLFIMFSFSLCPSSLCVTPNSQTACLAGAVTSVQRAVHARRPSLALLPARPLGTTGCLAPVQDTAGLDPDRGPGPGLGPHPGHDHHPHRFAVGGWETFTGQLMLRVLDANICG